MKISTHTFKGQDINLTYHNKFLAYTFEIDGTTYGGKVQPTSKSIVDISNATWQLLTNALETYEAITHGLPATTDGTSEDRQATDG